MISTLPTARGRLRYLRVLRQIPPEEWARYAVRWDGRSFGIGYDDTEQLLDILGRQEGGLIGLGDLAMVLRRDFGDTGWEAARRIASALDDRTAGLELLAPFEH